MESFVKRKLSFDTNNFMKNVHTVFKNISLRACVPNFKVQRHFLQKLELLTHGKFYTNVHSEGNFSFIRRMLLRKMIKGNAQFVQKVIFEPSIDFKKT